MKNQLFQAFAEKSFVFLWIGEIFTQISFNLLNFFLILHIYQLTKSNTAVSLVVLSFTIPAIFFGILAGAYVDRWNKKTVLLLTNIIRGLLLILLSFLYDNVLAIYIISFIVSIVTQFFIPAETPMIPLVVRNNNLLSANALFGLGLYGSVLVAYLLSGPVLKIFGTENTLIFLSGLFFMGALSISLIKMEKGGLPKKVGILRASKSIMLREIHNAIEVMRTSRSISSSLFLLALSQILLLILAVVAPGYASQVLKISIEDFPLLFIAPAALGVLIGAIFLVNFFHSYSREKIMTFGLFLSGFAMLLLPFGEKIAARDIVQTLNIYLPHIVDITTVHLLVLLAFILGLANAFVFVPSNTILQEETSDELRGKVYGVMNAVVGVLSLIPIIMVGSLSDLVGVDKVIIGIGVALLGLGLSRIFFDI